MQKGGSSRADGIRVPKVGDHDDFPRQTGGSTMHYAIAGAEIAKNVMQLHGVDPDAGEIINKPIKRAAFLEHFSHRAPCLIGMKACGGAQHWARRLTELGHQVKLIPAKFATAFNIRNKNDAAEARAIWMATQIPGKSVAIKTEAQQAVLALHRAAGDQVAHHADELPARSADRTW
jgi:transposase